MNNLYIFKNSLFPSTVIFQEIRLAPKFTTAFLSFSPCSLCSSSRLYRLYVALNFACIDSPIQQTLFKLLELKGALCPCSISHTDRQTLNDRKLQNRMYYKIYLPDIHFDHANTKIVFYISTCSANFPRPHLWQWQNRTIWLKMMCSFQFNLSSDEKTGVCQMLTIQITLFKMQNVFLITILQLISKAGIYNVLNVFQRLIEGQKACGNCLFHLIQFAKNFV